MKKSTKGAIAASAAGVLLLGGAGSLAYWTAEGTADGGQITAGDLKLTDGDCGTGGWVYAPGSASAGDPVELFVPGDEITKSCTFTLQASGDNLEATLDAPATVDYTTTPAGDALTLEVDTTYAIAGTGITPRDLADTATVTDSDDGGIITATFNVTVPFGTADVEADPDAEPPVAAAPGVNGNATQDIIAALDDLTVTLTQVDPNAVQE